MAGKTKAGRQAGRKHGKDKWNVSGHRVVAYVTHEKELRCPGEPSATAAATAVIAGFLSPCHLREFASGCNAPLKNAGGLAQQALEFLERLLGTVCGSTPRLVLLAFLQHPMDGLDAVEEQLEVLYVRAGGDAVLKLYRELRERHAARYQDHQHGVHHLDSSTRCLNFC